jgi:large conductance mechanosensitive channel
VLKEFRAFITRGNLIEIAVGLVMALAFKALIDALVNNILMPLVAAIAGKGSFDKLTVTLHHSEILYGTFITALVNLVLVGAALFFFVVKPMNVWQARRARGKEEVPAEVAEEILLLREIRDKLSLTS